MKRQETEKMIHNKSSREELTAINCFFLCATGLGFLPEERRDEL